MSADVNGAINGLTAVENRLNGTTSAFRQAAPAALLLASAGAAVEVGFAGAVSVAATFERQMSGVRAVMSPDEAKQFGSALDDLAISLGAATTFTAQQVAGAFEELLKLGVSAPAILGGAGQAVLGLAAATGAPLTDSATVAAQALNAFHLSVSELPGVVDVLAGVINVTAADLNDIKLGFSDVAAVAHGMGLSLTDTAVTLGIFRDNAVTGNTAGTALKTMLLGLQPTTKQQKSLFNQLGITVDGANNAFFDAQGNIKDMASVAGVLQKALSGMTAQQRNATLETLFGSQGMIAANIIFSTGADGIRKYTSEVAKISAADQAAERLNNLLGRLEQLGGAFQSVQIIVGKFFLPVLSAVAVTATGVITAFTNLSPAAQRFLTAVVGIGGAVAGAVGGFVLLAPVLRVLGPSFGALISLLPRMLLFFGPIGIAAAALATDFLGVRTALQRAFAGIGPILGNFGLVFDKLVNGDVAGALDTFQAIIGALVPSLGPVLAGARATVEGFFVTFGPVFANFGLVLQKVFSGDLAGAFDTFRAIIGTVSEPLGNLLGVFQGIAGFVTTQLVPGIADLADRTMPILADVGARLGEVWDTKLSPALQTVGIWLSGTLVPFFVQLAEQVFPTLQTASEALATFWDTKMQPALQKVGDFIDQNLITSIRDLGTALSSITTEQVTQAGNAFATTLLQPLQTFGEQLQPLIPVFQSVGNFFTALSNVIAAFQSIGSSAAGGGGGTDPIVAGLQRLVDFVRQNTDLGDIISKSFGPFGDLFRIFTENAGAVSGFIDATATALNNLAVAIRGMPEPPAWLIPFLHGDLIGGAGGIGRAVVQNAVGPQTAPVTPGGTQGGINVNFNAPIAINGASDFDTFLARVSNAVADAAGRVAVPPDNSSHPTLLPSVT